eukprot:111565-Chlamydomonas_euryale.AAC.1
MCSSMTAHTGVRVGGSSLRQCVWAGGCMGRRMCGLGRERVLVPVGEVLHDACHTSWRWTQSRERGEGVAGATWT